jgi:hypothetical protein
MRDHCHKSCCEKGVYITAASARPTNNRNTHSSHSNSNYWPQWN